MKRLRKAATWGGVARLASGVGAGDDLHELLRDLSLARTVHLLLEADLEVLGVVGRRLHRRHTRGQLRRDRLLQSAQQLPVEVEGKDRVEELRGLLLEDHVGEELLRLRDRHRLLLHRDVTVLARQLEDLVTLHLHARRQQRHERARLRRRRDHRDERRVEELDAVEVAGVVRRQKLVRDLRRLLRRRRLAARDGLAHGGRAALEVGAALVADEDELDVNALALELLDARLGTLDRRRVVRAAQAAVARDDHEADLLGITRLKEGDVKRLRLQALQQAAEDALEGLRERARAQDRL